METWCECAEANDGITSKKKKKKETHLGPSRSKEIA